MKQLQTKKQFMGMVILKAMIKHQEAMKPIRGNKEHRHVKQYITFNQSCNVSVIKELVRNGFVRRPLVIQPKKPTPNKYLCYIQHNTEPLVEYYLAFVR